MHAEDRLAGADKAVQRFEHEPVAAERHDHVGFLRVDLAVVPAQLAQRKLRRLGFRGDKRDARRCPRIEQSGGHPPVTLMWRDDRRAVVAAVDDEIVALRLAGDRLADRRLDRLVAFGLAQRRAQIGRVLLAEAHIQRAGAGQPHPVAAFAEIMGQRRDEAEPPSGLAHRHIARRPAGAVIGLVERPAPLQPGAHQRQRQVLVEPVLAADIAHRHDLDDDEVEPLIAAPGDEIVEFVLVDAAQRDRVDLDREPGPLRGGEPVEHLVEPAAPCDLGELRRDRAYRPRH